MLKVSCELESITPARFNRHLGNLEKEANESRDDFEKRIWQERGEYDEKDHLFLNRLRFKTCIALGAQWLNMKIPGEGNSTYTKLFKGSLIITNHISLKVHRGDVEGIWLFTAPKKGQGSRWVCFPQVEEWAGTLECHVHDEKITPEVFQ